MIAARARDPRPEQESDAALVAMAVTGDVGALGSLYDRYATSLLATAYRLLGSRADAEDVLHDVFVGLPEALRRYEERGALESWLKRVVVRVSLTRLRDERAGDYESLSETTAVAARMPDTHAVMSLQAAIAELPNSLRAVLMLKEVEGFTHAEIGEVLGISRGASEVRLHRALRLLRAALTKGDTV